MEPAPAAPGRLPRTGRARQARPAQGVHRLCGRRRQDLPHARRGPRAQTTGRRRRPGLHRDAWAGRDRRADRGTGIRAAPCGASTAAWSSRRWTSRRSSRGARRWSSWTRSRTPTRPDARNRKRYQDVLDILEAGINVICAFNVQHLESLNDLVERVTGVVVRETVPDSFLKQADQVVNLDLAAEDLLERLRSWQDLRPAEDRVGAGALLS